MISIFSSGERANVENFTLCQVALLPLIWDGLPNLLREGFVAKATKGEPHLTEALSKATVGKLI
ncbi:MAG: hypothetical protein M1511_19885 [Deltaproteobacteria bacterium]|nr:hypothetical protein [Deltaproteobacteria bacterium]